MIGDIVSTLGFLKDIKDENERKKKEERREKKNFLMPLKL